MNNQPEDMPDRSVSGEETKMPENKTADALMWCSLCGTMLDRDGANRNYICWQRANRGGLHSWIPYASPADVPQECGSEDGITVGIIDSIILLCRLLEGREIESAEGVDKALNDAAHNSSVRHFHSLLGNWDRRPPNEFELMLKKMEEEGVLPILKAARAKALDNRCRVCNGESVSGVACDACNGYGYTLPSNRKDASPEPAPIPSPAQGQEAKK